MLSSCINVKIGLENRMYSKAPSIPHVAGCRPPALLCLMIHLRHPYSDPIHTCHPHQMTPHQMRILLLDRRNMCLDSCCPGSSHSLSSECSICASILVHITKHKKLLEVYPHPTLTHYAWRM